MPNRPLLIGITGGIGSGKTIVCKIFNILGVPVYEADVRAKAVMINNPALITSIKNSFGNDAYLDNGEINKVFLSNQIFRNKEKLELLNSLVHPCVAIDFEEWIENHEKNAYLIKEAALLVESGSYKFLDFLITINAPIETRIERVLARDAHLTRDDVDDIISKQLSEEEKIAKSRFVIENDDKSLLIPQVLKIHEILISS